MSEPYIHWSELVSNLAIATASVVTPILGIFGFRSWRRELTGKTKYQSAHKIILSLYKIRDQIDTVRTPFFDITEYHQPSATCADLKLLKDGFRQEAYAYNNRLVSLKELYGELRVLSLEAEALWPSEVKKYFEDAANHLNKLFITARTYYNRERKDDQLEPFYKIIIHHDGDDEYRMTLKKYIEAIENYFKSYLR